MNQWIKKIGITFCLLLSSAVMADGDIAELEDESTSIAQGPLYLHVALNYNWFRSNNFGVFQNGVSIIVPAGYQTMSENNSNLGGEASLGVLFPAGQYRMAIEGAYQYIGRARNTFNNFISGVSYANYFTNSSAIQTAGVNLKLINAINATNNAYIRAGAGAAFIRSVSTMGIASPDLPVSIGQTVRVVNPMGSVGLGLSHDASQHVEFTLEGLFQYFGSYNMGTFYGNTPIFSPLNVKMRSLYAYTVALGVSFLS